MQSLADKRIDRAFFISPIVDMERLILDMMKWSGVTERELSECGNIEFSFGEKGDDRRIIKKTPIFR